MENQNYRSELAKVRELFKNDRKMSDYLSDENILFVMKSIEIWRKNNTLNPYLEALRVARDSNYWIAYTLLTDEETKSLNQYQYKNIVQDFINTKVLKAKRENQLEDCCKSLKLHKVYESKVFADLIVSSTEFTEDEKSEILNFQYLQGCNNNDFMKEPNNEIPKINLEELIDVFGNDSKMDVNLHQLTFIECVLEYQRAKNTLNETLARYRVNKHREESDGKDVCTCINDDYKVALYLLSENELNNYFDFDYKTFLSDYLRVVNISADKKVKIIEQFLENINLEFENLMKEIEKNT